MKMTRLVLGIFILAAIGCLFTWLMTASRNTVTPHEQRVVKELGEIMVAETLGTNITVEDTQKLTEEGRKQQEDYLRYTRQEISNARTEMNTVGAKAKITLKIIAQDGAPVVGATVRTYFTQPEGSSDSALVAGLSDGKGFFTVEKLTKYQCRWEVSKEGFYQTQGRYEWQSKFTMEAYHSKRWQPWNPTIEVVLKEVRNPVEMQRKVMTLKFPANTTVGFDFLAGALVEPFGKGVSNNLLFFVSGTADNGQFYYTNTVTFPAGNGYIRLGEDSFSELKSLHTAPESGYSTRILFTYAYDREKRVFGDNNLKNEYMALKLAVPSEGKHVYGKMTKGIIGGLDYPDTNTASVTFTYYLNPTPNDRSLEYEDTSEFKTKLGNKKSE